MNPFERELLGELPLDEASAYFVRLKDFSKLSAFVPKPPDETGVLEGQFAAPVEQVLLAMKKCCEAEFQSVMAYHVYANTMRGLMHLSVAEEFEAHADDELKHAEYLLERMAVLGGPVALDDILSPPPMTQPEEIIHTMIALEQEGIALWRELHALLGENPQKFKVEEVLTEEQHHLDELWQLLPQEARHAVLNEGPGAPAPQAASVSPEAKKTASDVKKEHAQVVAVAHKHGWNSPEVKEKIEHITKSAGVRVHQFGESLNPNSLGGAFKLALQNLPPTVFVPEMDLEGNYKTAAERTDAEALETGRQRAVANTASSHESHRHSRGEQVGELVGKLLGAAGGVAAAKKHGVPAAIAGAVLGGHAGGKAGKLVGTELDVRSFKKKADAMSPIAVGNTAGPQVEAVPGAVPDMVQAPENNPMQAYIAAEQAAEEATDQAALGYYKNRFQQAAQQLQMAQQQAQEQSEQIMQLQQQTQAAQAQIDSAMQQGQTMQQQALNNIQQANAQATQAMQQAMALQSENMQQQQLATNMQLAFQKIRQQAMQMAATEPPPALTQGAEGQGMMSQQNQQMQEVAQQQQAAAQASTAGTPEATAGAEASPGAVPPQGGGAPQPPQAPAADGAAEKSKSTAEGTQKKEGSARELLGQHGIGAALGAIAGGAGVMAEGRAGSAGMKNKVNQLQQEYDEGGGFGKALNLARAKMQLAMREVAEDHPVAAPIMGSLMGASIGASMQPDVSSMINSIKRIQAARG